MTEYQKQHKSFRGLRHLFQPIIAEKLLMCIREVFGSKYVWLSWRRFLVIFLSPSRQVSSVITNIAQWPLSDTFFTDCYTSSYLIYWHLWFNLLLCSEVTSSLKELQKHKIHKNLKISFIQHRRMYYQQLINPLVPELFFLIFAHSVFKMWIIQEPNQVELWNKWHFEE
jgi:hypothetical protein